MNKKMWLHDPTPSVRSKLYIGNRADTAWIAANGAIYKTTNGGGNWIRELTTTGLVLIVRFFDSNNGTCLGDGSGGFAEIYTTTTGG